MNRKLSFGLPPIRTAGAKLAVGLVVGSILSRLALAPHLLLSPAVVVDNYELWQFFTYGFVATSPTGVIFGALILWSIGGSLEQTWGARRMVIFALGTTVAAGLLTFGLAFLIRPLFGAYFSGGNVMTSALWIAFGLSWGQRQTGFWGMPVTGNVLALIGVGFVVLNAAFEGPLAVIPDAFAILITFAYVKLGFPERTIERFNSWRLRRQLARRRAHLDVVSGQKRNMPTDSDRFLH